MDIKLKVGARLKEIRLKKNISQEQLYRKCNVDRTYISDVENGKRNISVETLGTLLEGLGVTFKYFFSGNNFY